MSANDQPLIASDDVRAVLDTMAKAAVFPKNAVIFRQGDDPVGVYIVRKGAVRMTVTAGDAEVVMRIAHPGSVLGLPGVLSNKPYSLTARTVQPCEAGFVKAADLTRLVRDNPTLGLQVLQLLSEEVRAARGAIASGRQTVKI